MKPTLRLHRHNYYPHQWDFLTSKKPINGLIAGYGAGKTHAFLHKTMYNHITKTTNDGYSNGWIIYPTYDLAKELFVEPFQKMLSKLGITNNFNYGNSRLTTACGIIKVYQLQRPQRIIGAELTYIGFDEFDIESYRNCDMAFKKAIGRMRGSDDCEIYIVSTPEGYHYCHKIFVEDANEDRYLVHGKTEDNKSLPQNYLKLLKNTYDKNMLAAYMDGQFVNIQQGSTYYGFNREKNVRENKYNPTLPVRCGIDFNVSPLTCSLFHIYDESPRMRVFGEIELHHSGGAEILTERLVMEIKGQYPNQLYIAYPDPANRNKQTSALHTDHDIIRKAGIMVKVKPAHPRVTDSVNSVNKLCDKDLIIDPSCKGLIADLEQTVNRQGTREIDKSNKERTHFSDGLRYAIDYEFPIIKPLHGSIPR